MGKVGYLPRLAPFSIIDVIFAVYIKYSQLNVNVAYYVDVRAMLKILVVSRGFKSRFRVSPWPRLISNGSTVGQNHASIRG